MTTELDLNAMEQRARAAADRQTVDDVGHCIYCGLSPYEYSDVGLPTVLNCCETQVLADGEAALAADVLALLARVRELEAELEQQIVEKMA